MLSLPLPSLLNRSSQEVPVLEGDLPQTPDPRLAMRWAIAGLAMVAIPVVLLTAQPHLGPGIRYDDVVALCGFLAAFAAVALVVPWQRLEDHWLLVLAGVPIVFVAALNSLTGAGQSPYLIMYAPLLAVAGWYLSGRQTGFVIALVIATEVWRASALDRSGSIDHLAVALPFLALIAATASLTSRWLRNTLIETRRDQIRMANMLDAVRALGTDPQVGILTQLERATARLFDARATAIRIGAERPSDVKLTPALVDDRIATIPVPGAQRLHALLRIEARDALTAHDIRLTALLAEAAGRTLDSQQQREALPTGRERDALTGLLNRRALEMDINAALASDYLETADLALLFIDINDLRRLNDAYGHSVGDTILIQLTRALQGSVDRLDAAYRIGGDEFAVLLRGGGTKRALALAQRIRRRVGSTETAGDPSRPPFEITMGAAALSAGGSARDLLAAADKAIYEARQANARASAGGSSTARAGVHI